MKSQPSDTAADVEAMQLQLLREKTPAEQRGRLALQLSSDLAHASKRAIARAHPEFSPMQAGQMFVELHYGKEVADALRQYQGAGAQG